MGLPFSLLGKLGLPSVDKLTSKQVHENFFRDIDNYEAFHRQFINLCSKFNNALPGKHYYLDVKDEDIKSLYEEWKNQSKDDPQGKLLELLTRYVKEYKASSKAMMVTGLVAPTAAVVLRKSSQKVPQLKILRRLDFVPDAVVVPTITLLSLVAVRMFNISKAPAKLATA